MLHAIELASTPGDPIQCPHSPAQLLYTPACSPVPCFMESVYLLFGHPFFQVLARAGEQTGYQWLCWAVVQKQERLGL